MRRNLTKKLRVQKKFGETANVQLPMNRSERFADPGSTAIDQIAHGRFVPGQVSELRCVFQGEPKRFECPVEAVEAKGAWGILRGANDGRGVCAGTEPDIPNNEWFSGSPDAFRQSKLLHVERFSLSRWSYDGMKSLAFSERPYTERAVLQFDQLVIHSGTILENVRSDRRLADRLRLLYSGCSANDPDLIASVSDEFPQPRTQSCGICR